MLRSGSGECSASFHVQLAGCLFEPRTVPFKQFCSVPGGWLPPLQHISQSLGTEKVPLECGWGERDNILLHLAYEGKEKNKKNGGESGIRTHVELPLTTFPMWRLRPLDHLSGMIF